MNLAALADFHFLRPLWLLLLLALPVFWVLRHRGRADAGAWRNAIDPHLLPHLIERIDAGSGRAGIVLAVTLWTIACVAIAGPAWEREPMPLYRNQAARVLALELGATMMAEDEKPSRFERARYKLVDILERSKDYQTALIGYAGEAFVAAPLTDDIGTVRNLVDALDPSTMPVAGNRAATAIEQAEKLIEQAGLHSGDIILLADSADHAAVAAAKKAHAKGFDVSVLGIGSTGGAPVALAQGDFLKDDNGNVIVAKRDDASLSAVASAGGGRFTTLSPDSSDIDALLVDRTGMSTKPSEPVASNDLAASTRWRDRGPWLLLLLVPLSAFAFRRGWLMALALAFVVPPRADAASFKDLWLRSDQQAAEALAKGDAKAATDVARSPDWHGGASFRAGDFESAASDYSKIENADGAYNEGNALAKLGRYDEALAAYDRALKLAPDMDDAKANKSAVEEWLKRKQKSQDKSQKQKQQPGDSKNPKQSPDDKSEPSDEQKQKEQESGEQNQQDQDQQQQGDSKSGDKDSDEKQGADSQQKSGDDSDKQQTSEGTEGATDQAQSQVEPSQGKPSSEQQKALSKAIDQQLASGAKPDKDGKPSAAVEEDDATQEKRQALEHLLQRVPDDPGGLLRRKFLLEHQRRQQRGEDNG